MNERFDIRFDREAEKEYLRLDQSTLRLVNVVIEELVYRADEVGKNLGNHANTKLSGCKEIKLRDAGIRIIYRVTNEVVEVLRIVYILAIDRRDRDVVFMKADQRLQQLKNIKKERLHKHLAEKMQWDHDNEK